MTDQSKGPITRLFTRKPVADLTELKRALRASSRTVFRVLEGIGYLTSYSHARRYYTLKNIPRFDEDGLWIHGAVLFSKDGTLRATIVRLVTEASAGKTHAELQDKLRLRVHDTLLDLIVDKQIRRAEFDHLYLYVSSDAARARVQIEARRHMQTAAPPPGSSQDLRRPLDLARVIDVLIAVIHHGKGESAVIAASLRARGVEVSEVQVDEVLDRYEIKKKLASRSRHLRR